MKNAQSKIAEMTAQEFSNHLRELADNQEMMDEATFARWLKEYEAHLASLGLHQIDALALGESK